jgi:hypothetical protein
MTTIRHGSELRGIARVDRSSIANGRFGRLFSECGPAQSPKEDQKTEEALEALGKTMIQREFEKRRGKKLDHPLNELEEEDENRTIPAGYTYLGQFIDHDITFDPVSSLQAFNDPHALEDFRTPRLDLDSIYGRGRDDQPYLYTKASQRLEFLLGEERQPPGSTHKRYDLPRNREEVALIGDPRNDENRIVSQLHALFLQFHNKVVDRLRRQKGTMTKNELFEEAQRIVRWHYQWIVLHDYLPKIVGQPMAQAVLNPTEPAFPRLRFFRPKSGQAYMPVEFSAAAFRFGHSMVRPSYALSTTVQQGSDARFHRIPLFSYFFDQNEERAFDALRPEEKQRLSLNGLQPLQPSWGIDWDFFFGDARALSPDDDRPKLPQPSYRIDAKLVDPLTQLPSFTDIRSLAHRNLVRGRRLGLPSGQAVAKVIAQAFPTTKILNREELWAERFDLLKEFPHLEDNTPLWFYILREAELEIRQGYEHDKFKGHHLGPVGGRIVAEVLVGLAYYDRHAYLRQCPDWTPEAWIAPDKSTKPFTMADLVRFVDGQ